MTSSPNHPICIVGAGPGGLAAGAALAARGIPFEIFDDGRKPGGIWDIGRERTPMYESAHFISSKTLSAFRDLPMPEDYPDYPNHEQILAYLEAYADHHGLRERITFGTRVTAARLGDDGATWTVTRSDGQTSEFSGIVAATGQNWLTNLPEIPGAFDGEVLHSFDYRDPSQFEGKRVLVVGGGNSGCDIACDITRAASRTLLSLRRGYWFIPKYVLGRPADVFAEQGPHLPVWLERRIFEFLIGRFLVGDLEARGMPKPDHGILESHPTMNTRVLDLVGHGEVEIRKDLKEFRGPTVVYEDGREEEVDVVVFATGYRRFFPFLEEGLSGRDVPLDLYLNVFHREVDSLFFVGLFETDGGAYPLYSEQADLIASALSDLGERPDNVRSFRAHKAEARPKLRGRAYVDSVRHQYYVTRVPYESAIGKLKRRMGWA